MGNEKLYDKTGHYSELKVMRSNAGHYIGREYVTTSGKYKGMIEPGSRESDYFPTQAAAQKELESTTRETRPAEENKFMYENTNKRKVK